jgi:hypothetical protein
VRVYMIVMDVAMSVMKRRQRSKSLVFKQLIDRVSQLQVVRCSILDNNLFT